MKTALLILAFHSVVFAQQPSLGEVARQERARQKSNTGNLKVTNESLGTVDALPPVQEPAKTAVKPEAEPPVEAKSEGPQDEAAWREAFKHAREDVKRAEDNKQVLQLELNRLNTDLLTRSDVFNREGQYAPLIEAKNKELAAAEKAVTDGNQKITDLEKQLRLSGAPIGWSR
jgi:hypothetical protein